MTAALLSGGPSVHDGFPEWNLGRCANCDGPLPAAAKPQTFCGDTCRATAHEVRELRRRRAAGLETDGQTCRLARDIRLRVESAVPLRGCDAEDWSTFIQWFHDVADSA